MKTLFTPENVDALLHVYHGFHDADIKCISLRPIDDSTSYLDAEIELVARNFQTQDIERVKLLLRKVSEVKLNYNMYCDYPNVRDDIAIGFFENLVFVDFGAACEPRTSAEDFRSLDNFFVCESVLLLVAD